jgi:hypothetical protein
MVIRPANKYDFDIFVTKFRPQYDSAIWGKIIYFFKSKLKNIFLSENDPWIILFTPKCNIMSPFALKLHQKEKKTLKKSRFLWIFQKNSLTKLNNSKSVMNLVVIEVI